ncbi:50S ribosomal protein L9 [Immundisolibacter sp.]|jgi:large subunit ribosomal protein L9|uniref:50S ribosomal protein L9 n=1 Tax=Immundisolibacter sp. TaxID=1934948 RepID=UPI00260FB8C6|nr:50S ribosomal protein L9 [Immundisolibacter sp.]MDD3650320.1 50S ribosomal protein L9 [Immundisolibacter sp.]
MQVILLEKIRHLGNVGDRVEVKGGYGRNYLLPKGKAVFASPDNIARFEQQRAAIEKAAADTLAKAQARAAALQDVTVTIAHKAGEGGRLFGSVTTREIAAALTAAGHPVERHELSLPEGAIRNVGSFPADVNLHADLTARITVEVVAE